VAVKDHTLAANARRNARGGVRRAWRWRATRDAAWTLLERHVAPGMTVAVVGAGNGHDLPLHRLGRRAGRLDLIDLDGRAVRHTRRRLRVAGVRADAIVQDVTVGSAEQVVRSALARRPVRAAPAVPEIGRPPYDVVIADAFLSQLLYPALADAGLAGHALDAALRTHGQSLTNAVVAGLARAGALVVCIEDVLGWWDGRTQPFGLDDVLAAAPAEQLALVERGKGARGCNGRVALAAAGTTVIDRAFWRWPFAEGTDYLVCATVART
jgi:hypothetical protein